jgi:hypothetical protein
MGKNIEKDCKKEREFAIETYRPYLGREELIPAVSDFSRKMGCEVDERTVEKEVELYLDNLRVDDEDSCILRCEEKSNDNAYWKCASSCYSKIRIE